MSMSPTQTVDRSESQKLTFLRWCNMQLKRSGNGEISEVGTDLRDGAKLVQIVSTVCETTPPKYFSNKPNQLQAIENVNIALKMLHHDGMKINGVGPNDIVEGNEKLLLGLLWQMILRYAVSKIKESGTDAKQGLLLWCQRKTAGYRNVSVLDFSTSWESGLALCALLHHYRPDLIDFDTLDERDCEGNIELVLDLADKEVGIPPLVDADTVQFSVDERSLVTYLAYFYHAFSGQEGVEHAGRSITKYHGLISSILRMRRDYERRITALTCGISDLIERWGCAEWDNYLVIATEYQSFLKYRREQRREWIAERAAVGELLGTIRIKLAINGMRSYNPPAKLEIADLNKVWSQLLEAERGYMSEITKQMRKYKDEARLNFATAANDLAEALTSIALDIAKVEDGEIGRQLEAISATSDQFSTLNLLLEKLRETDQRCQELDVGENDLTAHSLEDLEYELFVTKKAITNKLASIEKQVTAKSVSGASHALLDEFEAVFRHFDSNGRNFLTKTQFTEALASLGHLYSASDIDKIFDEVAGVDQKCSFKNFIEHLVKISNVNQTSTQILRSFEEIADQKPYLAREDLENALLTETDIDSLLQDMPQLEISEGDSAPRYDYIAYLQEHRM